MDCEVSGVSSADGLGGAGGEIHVFSHNQQTEDSNVSASMGDAVPEACPVAVNVNVEPSETPAAVSVGVDRGDDTVAPPTEHVAVTVNVEPTERPSAVSVGVDHGADTVAPPTDHVAVTVNVEPAESPQVVSVGGIANTEVGGGPPEQGPVVVTVDIADGSRGDVAEAVEAAAVAVNVEPLEEQPDQAGQTYGPPAGEGGEYYQMPCAEGGEQQELYAGPTGKDLINCEYSKFAGEIGMDRYPGSMLRFDYKNYQNAYEEYYESHEHERIQFDNVNPDSPYGYGTASDFHGFTWNEARPMSGSLGTDCKPRDDSRDDVAQSHTTSGQKPVIVKKGVTPLNFVKAGSDFKSTVVHVADEPKLMVPASVVNNRKGVGFLSKKDQKLIKQQTVQNRANKPVVNLLPASVSSMISGAISDQKFCSFARVVRRKQAADRNAIQVIHLAKDQCRMIISDEVQTGPRARNGFPSFICVLKVDGVTASEGTAMNKKKAKHTAYDNAMQLFLNEELTVKEVNGEHRLQKKEGSAVAKPGDSGAAAGGVVRQQGGQQAAKGGANKAGAPTPGNVNKSTTSAGNKCTESSVKEQYAKPKIVFRQPKPSSIPGANQPLQFLPKRAGCTADKAGDATQTTQTNQKRAEALTDQLLASVKDTALGREKGGLEPGEIDEKIHESVAFVDNRYPKGRASGPYGGGQQNEAAKRMITKALPTRYGSDRFQPFHRGGFNQGNPGSDRFHRGGFNQGNPGSDRFHRGGFHQGNQRAMANEPINFQKGGVYVEEQPQGENVVDMRKPSSQPEQPSPQFEGRRDQLQPVPSKTADNFSHGGQPSRSFTGPLRSPAPRHESSGTVPPKFAPRHFNRGQDAAGRGNKRDLEDGELDEPLSVAGKRRKNKVGVDDLSEFVILDYSRVNAELNALAMLHMSANFNKVLMKYEYTYTDNGFRTGWSCCLLINDETAANVTRDTKEEAKNACSEDALAFLRQFCYSIIIKQEVDNDAGGLSKDAVLSDIQSGGNEMLPASNVGNMLLRKMGWEGGGVGKHGTGIAEPIKTDMVIGRQGLGGTIKGNFPQLVNKRLVDYVKSEDQKDLHFNAEFSKEERAIIHKSGQRLGLKTHSKGKEPDRYIIVSRKRTPAQLLDHVMSSGGSTSKYEVIQPTNPEVYERKVKHNVLAFGHSKQ